MSLLSASKPALVLAGVLLAGAALAEPFVFESLPPGFDGVIHPWAESRRPVAVDFNGDGEPSWYAGGTKVANPKPLTPGDPYQYRYANVTLPPVTNTDCAGCEPLPAAFAVGDLNRDGKPDIVRMDEWPGQPGERTLSVFLGDGNDGFTAGWRQGSVHAINFPSGAVYFELALADFDLDGDPDLAMLWTYEKANETVTPKRYEGSLRILWNTAGVSGPTFASETVLEASGLTADSRLAVGDFDHDGDMDVMGLSRYVPNVAPPYDRDQRLFRNDRAQTFAGITLTSAPRPDVLADIDRDGWLDYLSAYGTTISTSMSDHAGYWTDGTAVLTNVKGLDPLVLAMADVNEDGLPDLVTGEGEPYCDIIQGCVPRDHTLAFYPGQGDGSLGARQVITDEAGSNILQIGVGDARGDADQDLLLRKDCSANCFTLMRNTAQRLDVGGGATNVVQSMAGLSRLGVMDSNRDGIDDVFALDSAGQALRRFAGNGSGLVASQARALSGPASDFAFGDFNRDGRPDLAYVDPVAGAVRTVTQDGGAFSAWPDAKIADYPGAALIRAGNGATYNDSTDLLVGSTASGGLRWLLNVGNAASWNASDPRTSNPLLPDSLVLAPHFSGTVTGDAPFACGADGAAFDASGYSVAFGWYLTTQLAQANTASSGICAIANLDRDAEPELVFVNANGWLAYWNTTSDPAVIELIGVPLGTVNAIKPVDWNRDGLDDLLVATTQGLYLYLREGAAESWERHGPISGTTAEVKDVVTLDVNRDSRPDAAFITASGLQLKYNTSRIVATAAAAVPVASPASVTAGQADLALAFGIVNPGRPDEDAAIAVTGLRVKFYAALQSGGNWVPGPALTGSQVQETVARVDLLMDGKNVGTAPASEVAADGSVWVDYGLASQYVPIAAGTTKDLQVQLSLKPTAGSATYTDFFVEHATSSGGAAVMFDSWPTGRAGDVVYLTRNRVHIVNDVIFKNGFD